MNKRILMFCLVTASLYGCVNQGRYAWGPYEDTLFAVYHEPAVKEDALKEYLEFIDQSGSPERRVAPGLYAEAGTFLLERGDVEGAIRYYELERDAWPESQAMMDAMIANLEEQE